MFTICSPFFFVALVRLIVLSISLYIANVNKKIAFLKLFILHFCN
nr:MAG TPA: hypothetical protein [Caudoviricetes sp.]